MQVQKYKGRWGTVELTDKGEAYLFTPIVPIRGDIRCYIVYVFYVLQALLVYYIGILPSKYTYDQYTFVGLL